MKARTSKERSDSRLWDEPDSFGWISITLHWLAVALIVVLWFFGKSITEQLPDEVDVWRSLHVSLAVCSWPILLLRIVWRARTPHPRASGQSMRIHQLARGTHYAMLAVLPVMLLSGPVTVWAQAKPTRVFDFVPLPVAAEYQSAVANLSAATHVAAGTLLLILVLLHLGGALKHLMFSDDETFVRMFWPKRK